ncbi:hypothetical protein PZA11_001587 [Diplocarpon coronariae]
MIRQGRVEVRPLISSWISGEDSAATRASGGRLEGGGRREEGARRVQPSPLLGAAVLMSAREIITLL